MTTYWSKYIDPDFRRNPKTNRSCVMCQRDLKEGQPHRRVCYELDVYDAVHNEDWEAAAIDINNRRAPHLEAVVYDLIGMDCAKRLGLEYSRHGE